MTPSYFLLQQLNEAQQDTDQLQQVSKYVCRDDSGGDSVFSTDQSDGNSSLQEPENRAGTMLSVRWMSSKMKKMMNTDQTVAEKGVVETTFDTDNSSNNSFCNNIVRTCSDCNTTKTPLWRSGPRGPKSLCNACGIRQRKARRAMAAAQAEGGETSSTSVTKLHIKKKRCKPSGQNQKKLCFEDFVINLSKNSAYQQVFPQDEKEAAILLMALSCGLSHG
ncbi:hypothetical protein ACHQM5_029750 [Ranunculus cassubicifolius]